jgi:hypothetical protein
MWCGETSDVHTKNQALKDDFYAVHDYVVANNRDIIYLGKPKGLMRGKPTNYDYEFFVTLCKPPYE